MKIKYDPKADALYVRLKQGKISRTKGEDGHLADYDQRGNLLGFEILNYSKQGFPLTEQIKLAIQKA